MLGSWSVELTTYSILLRLVTVIILTSIIGCERSSKRHSAGLRTFVLVSFSSCVAMILDLYLMQEYRIGLPLLSTPPSSPQLCFPATPSSSAPGARSRV